MCLCPHGTNGSGREGRGRERGKKGEKEGGMEGVGWKGGREREREGGNGESNILF